METQKALEWCKAHELMPLTTEEYGIWQDFLPAGYVNSRDIFPERQWPRRGHWENYTHFEGVPTHVRELIRDTKGVFTTLEIRTPEKRPQGLPDPALFGHVVLGNSIRTFLLARWAESDANFLTFEDVKKVVEIRKVRAKIDPDDFFLSFLALLLAVVCGGVAISCGISGTENGFSGAMIFSVISIVLLGVSALKFRTPMQYQRAGSTKKFPWLERFI